MKDRVTIDIHLKNGGKIDLIWFLVFRITQRYLENYEAFCKDEKFEKKEVLIKGDWICEGCSFHNFKSRETCLKCSKNKK